MQHQASQQQHFQYQPHLQHYQQQQQQGGQDEEVSRRPAYRRTVDHGNSISRWMLERKFGLTRYGARSSIYRVQPEPSYIIEMLPPAAFGNRAETSMATKFVHTSTNKIRIPIMVAKWTPEGRRIVTGSRAGEFTLWNGFTFNFESIMQAHDHAICAMTHSHSDDWLLSGDREGIVKFWQPNFNNLNILKAHEEMVRDISFSPNDTKFVTASDDGTLKVWNFNDSSEERTLKGHNWDVKCADWHPTLGLIASGSKDNTVKLWDPRISEKKSCVATYLGFKKVITRTKFQKTGGQQLLASGSMDQTVRVLDLRTMTDVAMLQGTKSEISSIAWHPIHANLLSAGTQVGSICHYLLDKPLPENTTGLMPSAEIIRAHEAAVWSLDYHPLGHLLASGSNDRTTRIWARARPGDTVSFEDWYHTAPDAAAAAAAGVAPSGPTTAPGIGGSTTVEAITGNSNGDADGSGDKSATNNKRDSSALDAEDDMYGDPSATQSKSRNGYIGRDSNSNQRKKKQTAAIPGLGLT